MDGMCNREKNPVKSIEFQRNQNISTKPSSGWKIIRENGSTTSIGILQQKRPNVTRIHPKIAEQLRPIQVVVGRSPAGQPSLASNQLKLNVNQSTSVGPKKIVTSVGSNKIVVRQIVLKTGSHDATKPVTTKSTAATTNAVVVPVAAHSNPINKTAAATVGPAQRSDYRELFAALLKIKDAQLVDRVMTAINNHEAPEKPTSETSCGRCAAGPRPTRSFATQTRESEFRQRLMMRPRKRPEPYVLVTNQTPADESPGEGKRPKLELNESSVVKVKE